uniref:Uncharacterized protein n=1 Tax=Oryza sativa subsp. japonica TaxID=39947 RepID=Q6K3V1_ORYSJ|nr:hypothetical protein [Oryza sativa Japonica Group]
MGEASRWPVKGGEDERLEVKKGKNGGGGARMAWAGVTGVRPASEASGRGCHGTG